MSAIAYNLKKTIFCSSITRCKLIKNMLSLDNEIIISFQNIKNKNTYLDLLKKLQNYR